MVKRGTARGKGAILIGPQAISDLNLATGTSRSSARVLQFLPSSTLTALLLQCHLNIGESVRFAQIENGTCERTFASSYPRFYYTTSARRCDRRDEEVDTLDLDHLLRFW